MAITRAQQVRQMYKKGSKEPVEQAGVMNYMPSEMVTVPKIAKSSPDTPTAKLAYITPEEQDILIDLNLYGSLDGKPNRGPGGIPSLEGDFGTPGGFVGGGGGRQDNDVSGRRDTGTGDYRDSTRPDDVAARKEYEVNRKKREADEIAKENKRIAEEAMKTFNQREIERKALERRKRMGAKYVTDMFDLPADYDPEKDDTAAMLDLFINDPYREDRTKRTLPTPLGIGLNLLEEPLKAGAKKTRSFFADPNYKGLFGKDKKSVLEAGKFNYKGEPLTQERFDKMSLTEKNQAYKDYMSERLGNKIDAYGNPLNTGNDGGGGDGGMSDYERRLLELEKQNAALKEQAAAPTTTQNPFAFRFLADGGRAGFQEGGIMPRLNQLGSGVSSAEQMLQEINQRLESAESSLGSGGGGLGSLPAGIANNMMLPQRPSGPGSSFMVQPRPGSRPFLGATIDPNFKPVEELKSVQPGDPSYRAPGPTTLNGVVIDNFNTNNAFPSVEEAYADAQKEAQKTRAGGFLGQVVLPGEMSFDDFSNMFTPSNNFGQPMQLPLSRGGPGPDQLPGLGGGMGSPIQQAVGMADGGIMDADIVGGMMDGNMDEMGRQMYGLGKLVKKATRAVKKIAKSPIGKAALLYTGAGALGNLAAGKGFASMFSGFTSPSTFLGRVPGIFSKGGLQNIASRIGLGKFKNVGGQRLFEASKLGSFLTSPAGLIAASSALPFLFKGDEEEEFDPYRGPDIDIDKIRSDPYGAMGGAYRLAADGGLMRQNYDEAGAVMSKEEMKKLSKSPLYKGFKLMYGVDPQQARDNDSYKDKFSQFEQLYKKGYQEGGDVEPVAKKTMPLIDMDGKEKDYRETGGFVDMGRMERADDVPARLSKNEFVFTADAVRNAGEGDIDKGAEVMYNMMKNLEAGGEVSEESQGLEGARKMFQTSQRLGEVI